MPQPQPISCGRYSHGMPVFSTKMMPVSAARSGTARAARPSRLRRLRRQQRLDDRPQLVAHQWLRHALSRHVPGQFC